MTDVNYCMQLLVKMEFWECSALTMILLISAS
jgi:hypothetical protein